MGPASGLHPFSRRRRFAPVLLVGSGLCHPSRFSGTGGFFLSALLAFALAVAAPYRSPAATDPDPGRFAESMTAFDRLDATNPPPSRPVVFVGSSSIRLWPNLPGVLPGIPVLNRGFGGSHLSDVLHHLDSTVLRYRPPRVVVYAGDNDLADGKSPERVAADFRRLVERIRERIGPVPIDFLSIKPCPLRLARLHDQKRANRLVEEYARSQPDLRVIDLFSPLLGARGAPREDLFRKDRLHLNEDGYAIWNGILRKSFPANGAK